MRQRGWLKKVLLYDKDMLISCLRINISETSG